MDSSITGREIPAGVDPAKPNTGRMYDYYLNGRHYLPVDEEAAKRVLKAVPEAHYIANANRVFLQRAAGAVARAGVRQVIDIGAGIPTQWNSHEVFQVVHPDARVVYVDNDPIIIEESREMLRRNGESNVAYVEGDIREPASILKNPEVLSKIDFSEPVCLMNIAIWHFVPDEQDPYGLLRSYLDAVPAGSHLALSHITADGQKPEKVQRWLDVYKGATAPLIFRGFSEVDSFFDGLEYLPRYPGAKPGLSYIDKWGSKNPAEADPAHTWGLCGVGKKV